MLLPLLLIFSGILNQSDPYENLIIYDSEDHLQNANESKNSKSSNDQKPDLVPLEFPLDLYEKEGEDVYKVIKKKMEDFFGETLVDEMLKYETSDGVLDYMSKADFHHSWINAIINTIGEKLKSTEKNPLDKINSNNECRKACRKNHRELNNYLQQSFENLVSSVTNKDLRLAISQDPRKSYTYILNPETNKYECKCLDTGYIVKVSPTLKELVEEKYFQNDGKSLAEKIAEVDSNAKISSVSDLMSWSRVGNLALYMVGWRSNVKRDYAFESFVREQGLILLFLFVFCHCLFYPYLIYCAFLFLAYMF